MCKLPDGRNWWWEKLGLALVGRPLLRNALVQLSADWWVCAPSLVVFGLRYPPFKSMVELMITSRRAYAEGPFRTAAASASIPVASTGDPPILAGGFGSVSSGVTDLFL